MSLIKFDINHLTDLYSPRPIYWSLKNVPKTSSIVCFRCYIGVNTPTSLGGDFSIDRNDVNPPYCYCLVRVPPCMCAGHGGYSHFLSFRMGDLNTRGSTCTAKLWMPRTTLNWSKPQSESPKQTCVCVCVAVESDPIQTVCRLHSFPREYLAMLMPPMAEEKM